MINRDMPDIPVYIDESKWLLRWSKDIGTAKKGDEAGCLFGRGYKHFKYKGIYYLVHRVIFFKVNGYLPEQVDHIDGDTSNNNPNNLRSATHSQNMINRKKQKNNSSGISGVSWCKKSKKWKAQIQVEKKKIHLGLFKNIKNAVNSRISAEVTHFGDFRRKTNVKTGATE